MATVIRADRWTLQIAGLEDAAMSDVLAFENDGEDARAVVVALQRDHVIAAMLSGTVRAGDRARVVGPLDIACGGELAGRVVDPLGRPRDGREALTGARRRLRSNAPSIAARETKAKPFVTGVKALDLLYPTGLGTRTLFAGTRGGERHALLLTCLRAQTMPSFFVSMTGAPMGPVPDHATGVIAGPGEPPAMRALAPAAAMAMAEHVRDEGRDALVVVEDLPAWAEAIRERTPGVSAAEIFSEQAAVLDRASSFTRGSITLLAAGDAMPEVAVSPTHPAFITDGVVRLEGGRPEIPAGLTKFVPRTAMRGLVPAAGSIRLGLAQWSDLRTRVAMISKLDRYTSDAIRRGELLARFLDQSLGVPVPAEDLVVLVQAYGSSVVDELDVDRVPTFDAALLDRARREGIHMDPHERPDEDASRRIRAIAKAVLAEMRSR